MMAIVLPHGVLFRGGEEGEIRKKLIEQNHIETIIGLPANIFFGTGIPTIIMILRQKREDTDIFVVDASKHFLKEGKNNKLQASDIKRITNAVNNREEMPKFSARVSKEVIRENDYNLNIPRYVDSAEEAENWDLHATMLGGIPVSEIDQLNDFWQAFPSLREALFANTSAQYAALGIDADKVTETITAHTQVVQFAQEYSKAFGGFDTYLRDELIQNWQKVSLAQQEEELSEVLFSRLERTTKNDVILIDKYQAYQLLNNNWQVMAVDLEMLQTEGFATSRQVDPNIVIKKKNGKEEEVQEGWLGRIMPFDLVQSTYLQEERNALLDQENRLADIKAELEALIDSFSEEEKDSPILNDSNTAFAKPELTKALKDIYADVESEEIDDLNAYLDLLNEKAAKSEKLTFIAKCKTVAWHMMEASKDGTYAKAKVNAYLNKLQTAYIFPNESFENKLVMANDLLLEEAALKKAVKLATEELHLQTKTTIENLSDDQVYTLLELKWIRPLLNGLGQLPTALIQDLTKKVQKLAEKYAETYADIAGEIKDTEAALVAMMDDLTGDEFDMLGLAELKSFLAGAGGDNDR